MGRMLCVVTVLVAQLVSEEVRAEAARGEVPVALKGLSPGRLRLQLDNGGGDGEGKPPLEPGKMVAEALIGIPAYLVFAFAIAPLTLVQGHSLAVAVVSRAALVIGLPAITALAQTLIGNSSDRTRVRFLPAWIAGIAANLIWYVPAQLLVSLQVVQGTAVLALDAAATWLTILGTPVVQMLVLNEFREAKPLDAAVIPQARGSWPEAPYASAVASPSFTLPLAAFRF